MAGDDNASGHPEMGANQDCAHNWVPCCGDLRCLIQAVEHGHVMAMDKDAFVIAEVLDGVIGALRWAIAARPGEIELLAKVVLVGSDCGQFPSRLTWCGCLDTLQFLLGANTDSATASLIRDCVIDLAESQ